jgi:hypothetical protein
MPDASLALLNPAVLERRDHFAAAFRDGDPFRHVVIDGFLREDYAQTILDRFPAFDVRRALNEAGEVGGKAVVEKIRDIGEPYRLLDDLIQRRDFLDLVGHITGIPELLYDPWYFGGGTHENREGQDLDPHVDFNRHPVEGWHRRLNLIVYLNPTWDDAWGGSLDLHRDPRTENDRIRRVSPLFNRAVIFETTEWSWHGFSRITLPEDRKDLSRRSVALYFYTRERPAEELADTHSTIYVDRPLPERFAEGFTLGAADVEELKVLLKRRDMHNQRLYRDLTHLQKQLEQSQAALHQGRLGRLLYFMRRIRARLRG